MSKILECNTCWCKSLGPSFGELHKTEFELICILHCWVICHSILNPLFFVWTNLNLFITFMMHCIMSYMYMYIIVFLLFYLEKLFSSFRAPPDKWPTTFVQIWISYSQGSFEFLPSSIQFDKRISKRRFKYEKIN